MSFTRSLLALTIGLGFSLSACTGEQGGDLDLGMAEPQIKAMGQGTGANGTDPAVSGPCMAGIIRAASEEPGQDPSDPSAPYNPALDDYRCNGELVSDPSSDPNSPPITDFEEVLEVMAWAGAYESDQVAGFYGNSFMENNWATDPVPTADGQLHHFASLVLAKFNHNPTSVPIAMVGPAISNEVWNDVDISDYSIEESMITILVDEEAPGIRMLRVFASDSIESACGSTYWSYFNERYCHLPLVNPYVISCYDMIDIRHEDDVQYYCKNAYGGTAYSIEEAHTCGEADVLKIYVKPGDIGSAFCSGLD